MKGVCDVHEGEHDWDWQQGCRNWRTLYETLHAWRFDGANADAIAFGLALQCPEARVEITPLGEARGCPCCLGITEDVVVWRPQEDVQADLAAGYAMPPAAGHCLHVGNYVIVGDGRLGTSNKVEVSW